MKSITTILKNIKLLFRSKASALVVLLAPLLIVLIVGVSFVDSDTKLNVGVVGAEFDLGERLVVSLEKDNNIIDFDSLDDCVRGITEGFLVSCVLIPAESDFGSNVTVSFFVDESRMNLVYRIISSVSSSIGAEQMDISQELTQDILSVLDVSYDYIVSLDSDLDLVISSISSVVSDVGSVQGVSSNVNTSSSGISVSGLSSDLSSLRSSYSNIRSRASDLVDESYDILSLISDGPEKDDFESEVSSFDSFLNSSSGNRIDDFDELSDRISQISSSFNTLRSRLDQAGSSFDEISKSLDGVESSLSSISSDIDDIKDANSDLIALIEELEYTSAETISRPFSTRIETVTANQNSLVYAFPYLLGLVVMLVGIMLSSTLVFIEKDSKAHFRNFTTPTKSFFFLFMTYLTAMIIIFVQIAVILGFAYFLLDVPVLDNLDVSILVLFVGVSIFVFIGMLIGKIFSTSEAITMTNIATGSIFLFLSNLVLPLETLPENIRGIVDFNPYVTVSESLRQALLFDSTFLEMQIQLAIMGIYSLVLIVFISILTKFSSIRIKAKKESVVLINGERVFVFNLEDLISKIEALSENDFDRAVKSNDVFRSWLFNNKYKRLSRKIKGKNKEDTLNILKKNIKK
ncbi:MAG: ABC transporter permease [Candidatus Woesearchaeota archaeon]